MSILCRQVCILAISLIATAVTPSLGLRQAADQAHLLVGAAVRPSLLSEAAYSATLAREFNMVEPEDVMKWWVVRRNAGTFDFREGDEVVRFAQVHGMKVRGHCLVWDHNNPDWLVQGHFTPAQLSGLLQQHITTEMKHYAGQVCAWDVVMRLWMRAAVSRIRSGTTSPASDCRERALRISSRRFAGRMRLTRRRCSSTTKRRAKGSTASPMRSTRW